MILYALKEYYDRKASDPDNDIPLEGFERKEIPFLIVIDKEGKFLNIEDTREKINNKLTGKKFIVPRSIGRTGSKSYETTFLLWDYIGYVLGLPADDVKSPHQHKTWLKKLEELNEDLKDDEAIQAIFKFYKSGEIKKAINSTEIKDCFVASSKNMSFKLVTDSSPVFNRAAIVDYVKSRNKNSNLVVDEDKNEVLRGICLVTGEEGAIARTHGDVKVSKDTKALVGIQKNSGYDSYGKEQGYNAPIIKSTEFAYVTALKTLLSSKQRLQVGDATTVFWSEKKSKFETDTLSFFSEAEKDNPDSSTEKIRELYRAAESGVYFDDKCDDKFFMLGLSPNKARISIRFWKEGTILEFARNIKEYFEDFAIVKPSYEPEYYSIWRILINIAVQEKSENIPHNMAGEFIRAIINGTPYPNSLYQATLRRIKNDVEDRVKPVRAASIKAYLNRYYRFNPNVKFKEVSMSLDETQRSTGYLLGRLFAVLERIQDRAYPEVNAGIRDKFYGGACASPVTVFPKLMRLKNFHLSKIGDVGAVINFEKTIGEILEELREFPTNLGLYEQGMFALGYYHQRQNFYKKRENNLVEESSN